MMDLQQMCRLCSFKLRKPRNIFTTPGLLDKISKFTDIQIRQGDSLPCCICDLCDMKLQVSDKFRHQVGETDKMIRAFILQHAAEQTDSRRSLLEETAFPEDKFFDNSFRLQSNNRGGIGRERMRLSGRRPWHKKLSKSAELRNTHSERSLTYSYETARSLVASYMALINQCRSHGFPEEFSLPSSFASSDNGSDKRDERAIRFAAARRRLRRKKYIEQRYLAGKKFPKNIASETVTNHDLSTTECGYQDSISLRVPADPLNLLKVKRVQPLVDEDSDSSADDFGGADTSRTVTWRRRAPGYRGFAEDLVDRPSTECSSSDTNFSREFRQSCSSTSSRSTVKINEQQSRKDFSASSSIVNVTRSVKDVEVSENRQSGAQCPVCDRVCVSLAGLKVHFRAHRSAKCQICEAPAETKEKYRDHMLLHVNPIGSGDLCECGVCKIVFKSNLGLCMHMRTHSKSVPAVKKCPHCAKTFGTLRGFRIHVSKSHSGFESG